MSELLHELDTAIAKGQPAFDSLVDLSIKLRRVSQAVTDLTRAAEENLQELEVLTLVYRSGVPYRMNPGQLLRMLSLTSGALTGRLDNLEAAGSIRRERGARDRRQLLVELTPAGVERVLGIHEKFTDSNLASLRAELVKLN